MTNIAVVWHQPDLRPTFTQAEFYQPGPVVTVGRIIVYSEGQREWDYHTADGDIEKSLRTPEEFRAEFPDGELPEDMSGVRHIVPGTGEASLGEGISGWAIRNNGWFDLYGPESEGEQGHLDCVAYDLTEAIADAHAR